MKIIDKTYKLNNGIDMPVFGLGTYLMKSRSETKEAIKFALKSGYRLIDTAMVYENHTIVAEAIKESGINRKDIFITSKIWINAKSKEDALKQFDIIMKELELEYLDLCLVHWYSDYALEIYQALEQVYSEGRVKAIGVSNFMVKHFEEFLPKVKVIPTVNQVELNPLLQQPELIKYCKEKNIIITSYQTLMAGKIGELSVLNDISKKHNVTTAQVALRWALDLGLSIIPKSVTNTRITENMDLDKVKLTDEDMKLISSLDEEKYGNADPYTFPSQYVANLK
ncbi:aldo/keto reductase [Spiroplasma endosymbiont of Othius punctulatus]|uniref:aldo/keto reductase n=1 Tax=Spiroplasma endosymbiont of Othius punctulatus TaxID=3066289 RepID=UPI0030CAB70F